MHELRAGPPRACTDGSQGNLALSRLDGSCELGLRKGDRLALDGGAWTLVRTGQVLDIEQVRAVLARRGHRLRPLSDFLPGLPGSTSQTWLIARAKPARRCASVQSRTVPAAADG